MAAAVLLCLIRYVVPAFVPGIGGYGLIGGFLCALSVILWWVLLSRARWYDRLGAVALMIVALAATSRVIHESIALGMMGMLFPIYAIQALSLVFVAAAVASRRLTEGSRRATMIAAILLACAGWTLLQTSGVRGDSSSEFGWRWSKTPEQRLLAQAGEGPFDAARATPAPIPSTPPAAVAPGKPLAPQAGGVTPESGRGAPALQAAPPATKIPETPLAPRTGPEPLGSAPGSPAAIPSAPGATGPSADWPGFRGPERDGVVRGVRIRTDWAASPPVRLWRRPIGPGWSSFAVHGDLLYTQEQRGGDEAVACYRLSTGDPVWRHRDGVRFWESNGGAGPRGTPTLSNGRVYALGATGILNVLDAGNGAVVWSRNAASDTGTKIPGWGFASSPLVLDDKVVIAAEGRLAAYDLATGNPRWVGPAGGTGYSSPQLVTIGGFAQVLLLSAQGATSVAPADGTRLWDYPMSSDVAIVQPALTAEGDVLISTSGAAGGTGVQRVAVAHGAGGWTVAKRWASTGLKPYFNDFVVHKGHAYGFDGSILSCIDLENGTRRWKGGRYGNGQLVLLPDQDLLLVVSEEGELALVGAAPDQFREIARVPGIEGKTWNHPVMVGDTLLVRNGQEMAAFRLSRADR